MTATIHRTVLCCHDNLQSTIILDISGESRELGYNHDHLVLSLNGQANSKITKKDITDLELSIILGCFNDPLDKCLCYLVLHRAFFARVRDAKYSKGNQITGSCTLLPYSQELVFFRSITNVNISLG